MRRMVVLGILITLLLSAATPARAQGATIHVVQPGENLFRIALRYGVTVDALAASNGVANVRRIYSGQRLVIPTASGTTSPPASSPGTHVVQRGENLYRIALRYGTTVQALAAANGIINTHFVYSGQRLTIPGSATTPQPQPPSSSTTQTYVVRRGDTLTAIALRYGVSSWSLAQANGIQNPSLIYVGQTLRIPGGGNSTPPTSPPPSSPPSSPPPAPTTPPPSSNSGRWIDINLSAQRVTAYEGNTPVHSSLASTGLSRTPTPTGQYRVYVKYVADDMAGPGYYLRDVPYVMYFYRGYSLHGTYWHSNFGTPMSHGCVNLPTPEAKWFFNFASVGTLVNIHY